ncbi:hypothetical protein KSP40_PGU012249 [Platanthera guangdongensis]|uniref:Uncharacterized protein n=1 Tax=Platanthera guangdongensis TaxID=2320717 RepID=A0ABR2ME35_9ASPA
MGKELGIRRCEIPISCSGPKRMHLPIGRGRQRRTAGPGAIPSGGSDCPDRGREMRGEMFSQRRRRTAVK